MTKWTLLTENIQLCVHERKMGEEYSPKRTIEENMGDEHSTQSTIKEEKWGDDYCSQWVQKERVGDEPSQWVLVRKVGDDYSSQMVKGESFKCCICSESFPTEEDLTTHKLTHIKCDMCGKSFPTEEDLSTYKLTHSKRCTQVASHMDNNAHICHVCNKGFVSANYQQHQVCTAGNRPFMCNARDKCFNNKNGLSMPEPMPESGHTPDYSQPMPDSTSDYMPDPKPAPKKRFAVKSEHEIDELADTGITKGTKKVTTCEVNVLQGNVKHCN